LLFIIHSFYLLEFLGTKPGEEDKENALFGPRWCKNVTWSSSWGCHISH